MHREGEPSGLGDREAIKRQVESLVTAMSETVGARVEALEQSIAEGTSAASDWEDELAELERMYREAQVAVGERSGLAEDEAEELKAKLAEIYEPVIEKARSKLEQKGSRIE